MADISWRDKLKNEIDDDTLKDLDHHQAELALKQQGKITDKVFMEARGRRGIYGQRYDNGFRHNGQDEYKIQFPGEATKGPGLSWHAPGMQRIKIPAGMINAEQLELMADLAEEYGDAIVHITTRQDIQIHFIHINDTADMFYRLAAAGITTKEACGNSIRNVTACPYSGVCHDESFDTSWHAIAMKDYLLGHDDVQDFGRKFKIAFSGCADHPCALTGMHDMGFIAKIKNGKKGFEMYVGGGLGAVPHKAKLFTDFLPEEELFPMTQAVCRIFARHGEKNKRSKARIKFLIKNIGIDEFKKLVLEERDRLKEDPMWYSALKQAREGVKEDALKGGKIIELKFDPKTEFGLWANTNVRPQKQEGYSLVTVNLPLGDITSNQARDLVEISRKYIKGTMRTTVEQNLVLRWVSNDDLEALYKDLLEINLADAGAGTILDITSCPGTDTCKLGVSSSRGLAAVIGERLAEKSYQLDEAVSSLRIKVSGCMNSCGMHHIADIGFFGVSRQRDEFLIPHFQLVLGGKRDNNAGTYGLAITSIPSKAVPQAVDRLTDYYAQNREGAESFQDFTTRIGKATLKEVLDDLRHVPAYEEDSSYYVDWADVRIYSTGDKGIGECSGEVISLTGMGLMNADREVFEAQLQLDKGKVKEAGEIAFRAMVLGAQSLIKYYNSDMGNDPDEVMAEFKKNIYDTGMFVETNANYFFAAYDELGKDLNSEQTHHRIEEAQLFIEEAYNFDIKRAQNKVKA